MTKIWECRLCSNGLYYLYKNNELCIDGLLGYIYYDSKEEAEMTCDILNRKDRTINELQERNNKQRETIEKQQEQIDNYIDIKAKLNAKITEYETKAEEYHLSACGCGSKHNWIKKTTLEEFKEELFGNG